jgi:GH15 family glucan-1,4-alpha-glucosidase
MPLVRFISPTDPRWLSTLATIERDLSVDTLVFRYRNEGSLDGSFTACSFWFIEALARFHQIEKARILFERCWATRIMLAYIRSSLVRVANIWAIFLKR